MQCHTGSSFSDSLFHNTGVGWDPKTKTFKDEGRFAITKKPEDRGAFKTPVLRDVSKHAPTCTTDRLRRFAKWSSCTTRAASPTRI